ncbi:hypothetical protein Peur_038835 [Populus x canadensis]
MGDEWFGVYAFCSLILLAFGQTLGHVCMLRVVILWSGYCQGFQGLAALVAGMSSVQAMGLMELALVLLRSLCPLLGHTRCAIFPLSTHGNSSETERRLI